MAIAPLPQIDELDALETLWPRPTLRLVTDPRDLRSWDDVDEFEVPERSWTTGADVATRRRARAAAKVRRRRVLAAVALLVVVVALALPTRALGTVTISGQQTPGGTPAGLMDGTVYVVQQGDSLASIAHQLNPAGDQRALIRAMVSELGSNQLVAGEHVLLP